MSAVAIFRLNNILLSLERMMKRKREIFYILFLKVKAKTYIYLYVINTWISNIILRIVKNIFTIHNKLHFYQFLQKLIIMTQKYMKTWSIRIVKTKYRPKSCIVVQMIAFSFLKNLLEPKSYHLGIFLYFFYIENIKTYYFLNWIKKT